MLRAILPALALVLVGFAPAAAQEPPARRSPAGREGIEALEAQLARAVDRVSLPHAARLLGRVESARGYRLPGYGVVFVLTPRALPGGEGHVYLLRRGAPRVGRRHVETRRPGPPPKTGVPPEEAELEALERQVLVLQHETESIRRAAEEEMEQLVREVRVRVSPAPDVHVEVVSPPEAPAPPAPPAEPSPPGEPGPGPVPPAPPPWKFWFEAGTPDEKRDPAAVVGEVREALVDALAAQGAGLDGLAAEERVTVTVDFVAGGLFAAQARPETTLVLSARIKDLAARARGALSPDEFRGRVEVTEY